MKYYPHCKKLAFSSRKEAWERVVYEKLRGMGWKYVYECRDCKQYHLTSQSRGMHIPKDVREKIKTPSRSMRKKVARLEEFKNSLPLAKRKKVLATLNNKPAGIWLRIKSYIWG